MASKKTSKKAKSTDDLMVPADLQVFIRQAHSDYMGKSAHLGQARLEALEIEQPIVAAMVEAKKRFNERASDVAKGLGLDVNKVQLDLSTMEFKRL